MKLKHLFEKADTELVAKVVDIVDRLTSNSASHDGWREDIQTSYNEQLIKDIQQHMPEIIHNGPMYRTVSVEGIEPISIEEIKQHALSAGVQSFARTKEGMEEWLEEVYQTMDFSMADTVLEQSGPGISTEKLLNYINENGLQEQFSKQLQHIERAADVTEVIAPYYPNVEVIETNVFDVEEFHRQAGMDYGDDEDEDY